MVGSISVDEFETLLADNDEFFEQIVKDIINFIKDETIEPLEEEIKQIDAHVNEINETENEDTL